VDIDEGAGTATRHHDPLLQPQVLPRQRLPPRPEAGATRAAQCGIQNATPCLLETHPLLLTYELDGYIIPSHWRGLLLNTCEAVCRIACVSPGMQKVSVSSTVTV
jgi:hypothetical protein